MKSVKIGFKNSNGYQLSGKIELPIDSHPHNYVLFAHCFTCNKNLTAVKNICRTLNNEGLAVLRFDFTGLGDSDGNFADTNFSSNILDLIAAADFLKQNYQAPSVLIGHSLGGAAVIRAAHYLPSVKAVATIGAPYDALHVSHLFKENIEKIDVEGQAKVDIGGRPFTVKQHFLQDLEKDTPHRAIHELNKSLLVLHSPQDSTVEIENATRIYKAAKQPKSFISLDGADHLLTDKSDSLYTGNVIAGWVKRYISIPEVAGLHTDKQVVARTANDSYTTDIIASKHHLTADEPEAIGGNDFGPTPYDYLLVALGACTTMTLQMYAKRKQWDLQEVKVHLHHNKVHAEDCDCQDSQQQGAKIDLIEKEIELSGKLNQNQRERLKAIAEKCPVHKTILNDIKIISKLK